MYLMEIHVEQNLCHRSIYIFNKRFNLSLHAVMLGNSVKGVALQLDV